MLKLLYFVSPLIRALIICQLTVQHGAARILRHLAAAGVIHEAGPDRFCATPMTKALAHENFQDTLKF